VSAASGEPASGAPPDDASAMSSAQASAALRRVLDLSQELFQAAESGDPERVTRLDAERRRLLESARHAISPLNDEDRAVLTRIVELNDQSLGRMEHRLRAACRDMDMLAAGRRAVRAYGRTRP